MKIVCPLQKFALSFPESILFIDSNRRITYRDADRWVSSLAKALSEVGLKRGERVATLARNSIDLCIFYLACMRCGISFVPLNLLLSRSELEVQLKLCNTSSLFYEESSKALLPKLDVKKHCLNEFTGVAQAACSDDSAPVFWELAKESCVIFTSGSRGLPKGVVLNPAVFYASAQASNAHTYFGAADTWLVSLPLYHVSGLNILVRALFAAASVYISDNFSRSHILDLIQSGQVTHLSLVPNMLEELLEINHNKGFNPALKLILLGGAAAAPELIKRAKDLKIPLIYSYGLTETFGHICCTAQNLAFDELSCGARALPHVQIEIVNAAGEKLAYGQPGRIKLKSKALFSGYLLENGYQPRIGDEFITQDLGILDEQGRLKIVGRIDDIINSGGEKFSSAEIELAARAFPQVSLAGVVAAPDQVWGQRPVLFVQVDKRDKFSCSALDLHLQRTLPKLKWPSKIIVMDQLPLTSLGKINYAALLTAI